jgi:hypothetical protein
MFQLITRLLLNWLMWGTTKFFNIQFGTGVLFGNPVLGNQPVNPTPFKFGILQEVTVDFKSDLKKLYGQYQFPLATARGKVNVDLKGKLAVFDPNMLNQLYWSQTSASGYTLIADGEQHTVANAQVAVTNTFPVVEDWGVQYAKTGQQLILVNSNVQIGQYMVNVNASVQYTFNSGDNGNVVAVSYTQNSNAGSTITLANQLMGYAPELKMLLYNRFRAKYFAIELNDVTLGSISVPTKLEDFWISDFDGSANADASNTLGKMMMDLF